MNYKLISRFKYNYNLNDLFYSFYHLRKLVDKLPLETYFGNKNIYYTNYARTGLTLLLKSISNDKRLKVGVQPYTCHTIFQAIENSDCEPVFIDINNNFTLDLVSLKKNIEKIDILIVTHTFGIPADIDEIKQIAHNKIIIEDCAHSLFSEYKGKPTGTFGDASIFSFGYGKYPSIGPGGFTIINNKDLISEFKKFFNKLSSPSFFDECKNILKNIIYSFAFKRYIFGFLTYPVGKRLDKKLDFIGKYKVEEKKAFNSNVNIFLENFELHKKRNKQQRRNGLYVLDKLIKYTDVKEEHGKKFNYYIFPLLHNKRDSIVSILLENGVESGKHFALSIEWAREFGYRNGDCPITERLVKEIFTIPCHYSLKEKELYEIIKLSCGFFK